MTKEKFIEIAEKAKPLLEQLSEIAQHEQTNLSIRVEADGYINMGVVGTLIGMYSPGINEDFWIWDPPSTAPSYIKRTKNEPQGGHP